MSDSEDEKQPRVTRRQILAAAGGVVGSASIAAGAGANGDNHITGGDMALDKAHNAAGDLWTGPEAGKSNVNPKAGRMYMTEDTNVVYIADGDEWGDPMPVGSEESPVPSINTEEVNNVFHAQHFDGANGSEKTQNALDHADSQPGRNRVVVGPDGPDNGDWLVSSPPSVPSNTELVFKGRPTLRLADGANDDVLLADGVSNIAIRGPAVIDGNNANNSPPSGESYIVGVNLQNVENAVVENLEIKNAGEHGIETQLSKTVRLRDIESHNNGGDGISISNWGHASTDQEDIIVRDCWTYQNGDSGCETDDGPHDVWWINCVSEDNPSHGFDVHSHPAGGNLSEDQPSPQNIHWINCAARNNGENGFRIGDFSALGESKDYHVVNMTIEGSGAEAIHVSASTETGAPPIENMNLDVDIEHDATNGRAIRIRPGAYRDCEISGTIEPTGGDGSYSAIYADNTADIEVFDVHGVTIRDSANFKDGIDIPSSGDGGPVRELTVRDCHIEGVSGVGIKCWCGGGVYDSPKLLNNTCKNNGQDSSGEFGSGITFWSDVENAIVQGNRCYDDQGTQTQDYGVYRNGDYNLYDANNVRGNATGPWGGSLGTNSVEGTNIT